MSGPTYIPTTLVMLHFGILSKLNWLNILKTSTVMITIALIDKFPMLRKGIEYILKDQFCGATILESNTISTFFKTYPGQHPDLIIMGISQNNSAAKNISFIKLIKRRRVSAALVVYDELPDFPMVLHYLNAGVNGYISKRSTVNELNECLKIVLQGDRYVSNEGF